MVVRHHSFVTNEGGCDLLTCNGVYLTNVATASHTTKKVGIR